jgi:hypothetical protein
MGAFVDLQVAGDPFGIPIAVGRKRLQGLQNRGIIFFGAGGVGF